MPSNTRTSILDRVIKTAGWFVPSALVVKDRWGELSWRLAFYYMNISPNYALPRLPCAGRTTRTQHHRELNDSQLYSFNALDLLLE